MNFSDSKQVFATPFAMVLSPSKASSSAAIADLEKLGIPRDAITEYPFPGLNLTLGFDAQADVFASLLRMAFFEDHDAAKEYFAKRPFRVLRMTQNKPVPKADRGLFPVNTWIARQTNITDGTKAHMSVSDMTTALVTLQMAIAQKYGNLLGTNNHVTDLVSGVPVNGFECIAKGNKCLGDCPDTYYPASSGMVKDEMKCEEYPHVPTWCWEKKRATLQDKDDEFIIVIGVNHKATGMAAYSSLVVYDLKLLEGIYSVDDSMLNGTAMQYFTSPKPDYAPYLFAYKFMRKCPVDEVACYSIPSTGDLSVAIENPLLFIERMYDNPVTHVGADPSSIVAARTMHFVGARKTLASNSDVEVQVI